MRSLRLYRTNLACPRQRRQLLILLGGGCLVLFAATAFLVWSHNARETGAAGSRAEYSLSFRSLPAIPATVGGPTVGGPHLSRTVIHSLFPPFKPMETHYDLRWTSGTNVNVVTFTIGSDNLRSTSDTNVKVVAFTTRSHK